MSLRLIKSFTLVNNLSRETRVYRDTDWDEYVVQLWVGGKHYKAADYHTDDKQDALDTALLMLDCKGKGA